MSSAQSSLSPGIFETTRVPDYPMHEDYFGFTEKPFSLTPDPKYLYRSASHGSAFELLQYAIRRREGFVVVTGDIGTGKTTLCRAVLDQLDRRTFTALVLNPFLSEEDLLRVILQDFGVVSRAEIKQGRMSGVTKQELIETLNEFLLSLLPLGAGALLIIDEAQNLPLETLEQIRILSNLETDKEKLLQIVLVGQPNLKDLLKSPALRQLDQRISIRFDLKPLTTAETAAYVSHRLTIAGGGSVVQFEPRALASVYRFSGGIPRLINLLCDRALLGAFGQRTSRIGRHLVEAAAANLELQPVGPRVWPALRKPLMIVAGGLVAAACLAGAYVAWENRAGAGVSGTLAAATRAVTPAAAAAPPAVAPAPEALPAASDPVPASAADPAEAGASYSVLVASFRQPREAALLSQQLRELGLPVLSVRVVSGSRGVWHQVLVGPYGDAEAAALDQERVRQLPGYADARVIAS